MCRCVNKNYPFRSLSVRIPVLRETWKETEMSPKIEGFQFGIEDIFLSFGALLSRRRTTHYRLYHDARHASSQSASARSGRHSFSGCETILVERNFLRSSPSHLNNIYVFCPFFLGFSWRLHFWHAGNRHSPLIWSWWCTLRFRSLKGPPQFKHSVAASCSLCSSDVIGLMGTCRDTILLITLLSSMTWS